jgi:hypothetical protein
MTSKIKPINATSVTYDRLKEIAGKSNMTMTALLKMLIDELYLLVATIDRVNIEFAGSQADGILKILVRDRNKMIVGEFNVPHDMPNATVDRIVKAKVEEQFENRRLKK